MALIELEFRDAIVARDIVFAGKDYGILFRLLTKYAFLTWLLLLCFSVLSIPPALVGQICADLKLSFIF